MVENKRSRGCPSRSQTIAGRFLEHRVDGRSNTEEGTMGIPSPRAAAHSVARGCATILLLLTGLMSPARSLAGNDYSIAVVVADFDNVDTSGEAGDRTAQHAVRVRDFSSLLREGLAGVANYKVLRLECDKPTCSVGSLGADALISAARRSRARVLVYGGIHKMSTLIQWGEMQAVDLDRSQLLVRRSFTFRGDSDEAFRHAAGFICESLKGITPR